MTDQFATYITQSEEGLEIAIGDATGKPLERRFVTVTVRRVVRGQVAVMIEGERASVRRVSHDGNRWVYLLLLGKDLPWPVVFAAGAGGGIVSSLAVYFLF